MIHIYYNDILIGELVNNRSITLEELLELVGFNEEEFKEEHGVDEIDPSRFYVTNKLINVYDDWTWVNNRVDYEMENDILSDIVHEYMRSHSINLDRIKELYHEAIRSGAEKGKYLSFSVWFHEFTKDDVQNDY